MVIFLPVVIVVQLAFLTGGCQAGREPQRGRLYRDIEQILGPIIQALFYFTPTFYPISYVPKQWM